VSVRVRPRRSKPVRRGLLVLGGLAVAFAIGIGLGESLHDNPTGGGTQTLVRTLDPLPLVPVAGSDTVTVTVTTSAP
jgi:hypothetical protein